VADDTLENLLHRGSDDQVRTTYGRREPLVEPGLLFDLVLKTPAAN